MAKGLALTATGMLAAGLTGCFGGAGAFICSTADQCDARSGGKCEPDGLCSYADSSCTVNGQRYGENSGDNSNKCVGETGGGDGGMDGPPPFCYGAENGLVKPCFSSAPTGDLVLPAAIDTDTSSLCTTPLSGGDGYCVIAGNTIRADDTVAATGSKPLVLVGVTSIEIASGATLDVASHHSSIPPRTGAGAGSADCTAGTPPAANGAGGGGAGGSFGGRGGNGGAGNNGAGTGGIPGATQVPTTLRGGCPGQNGINGTFGMGGKGGGAVYLIASTSITIESSGAINASGEGGRPGITTSGGGGGGGSGGMIGLDAPTITNAGVVFANGASGGEGSGTATPGNIGPEPTDANPSPAPTSNSSNGGNGGGGSGTGSVNGGNGQNGTGGGNPGGGGGGGGGVGVIKVYRGTLGGQHSPAPS